MIQVKAKTMRLDLCYFLETKGVIITNVIAEKHLKAFNTIPEETCHSGHITCQTLQKNSKIADVSTFRKLVAQ